MQADFALEYDVLTLEQPHRLFLMARLVSGPAQEHTNRRPLNLSLVIDRSGSMGGDKIGYTRQAAQFMVQNLGGRDILSVVLYNENVETLLAPEHVTHKDAIAQKLGAIKVGGMTNLSGGWLQACTHVAANLNSDQLNRVILMTDGLANRGITAPDKLIEMARQKREAGISTTTMGLGEDFNEDLLMEIADAGGGAFYFIESPEVAPLIFEEELRGLLNLVGQNLTVTIRPESEVGSLRQLNAYPMQTDGEVTTFQLGDIFGDEVKSLVLELSIPALESVGQKQIATLHFEYDEIGPGGSQHRVIERSVMVNIRPSGALPSPNPDVRRSVLLLQAAQARREAVAAADKGAFNEASMLLKRAAESMDDSALQNDSALRDEHEALIQQAQAMERGTEFYGSYNRKMMSTQAMYTMTDRHEDTMFMRAREVERLLKIAPTTKKRGVVPVYVSWRGQMLKLERDLLRIGRAPQNEIVLDAKNVSRFHCQIKHDQGQFFLEDLGSTNGTFVNDQPVKEAHKLNVGDVVRVGPEQLVFHDDPNYQL
jgi:Ca-activated chloride channel family protein